MKVSASSIASVVTASVTLASMTEAFVTKANRLVAVTPTVSRQPSIYLNMSSNETGMSEVERLKAAAAKAREEAAKLAKELGKGVDSSGNVIAAGAATLPKAKESISVEEITQLLSTAINFETSDAASQTEALNKLVESGDLKLWKSVARSSALRTFPVSLQFLESRTNGLVTVDALGFGGEGDVSMDDFKYATLGVTLGASVLGVAALSFLPDNIGATVCYFMALVPILFLAVGSTAPGLIAGAIQSARGTADSEEQRIDRICRHEAGHFLCGYLCGLPIAGYSTGENGVQCVEFYPSQDGPATGREFSQEEIAALACVSMSGSVAEVLGLGDAKGGENDLIQLDGFFRRSADFIGAQKQQDLTRWGALASYNLIKENKGKYDKLVDAFKAKKSVQECVAIVESR